MPVLLNLPVIAGVVLTDMHSAEAGVLREVTKRVGNWVGDTIDGAGETCVNLGICPQNTVEATHGTDYGYLPPQAQINQYIDINNVYFQNADRRVPRDDNHCGSYSGSRLLKYFGYQQIKGEDPVVFLNKRQYNQPIISYFNAGFTPAKLREALGDATSDYNSIKLEQEVGFGRMKQILMTERPVLALVRNDSINIAGMTAPNLHWILITGYDDVKRQVKYRDTDTNNESTVSYDAFLAQTAGAGTGEAPTWTWKVGNGVVKDVLYKNQIRAGTLIWIDKPSIIEALSGAFIDQNGSPVFSLTGEPSPSSVTTALDPVKPSIDPEIREYCTTVDSRQGWQTVPNTKRLTKITSISGSWSVDYVNYNLVDYQGHISTEDISKLAPHNQNKLNINYPFGTLFLNIRNYGYFGATDNATLPKPIEGDFDVTINDTMYGDNWGTIDICFSE